MKVKDTLCALSLNSIFKQKGSVSKLIVAKHLDVLPFRSTISLLFLSLPRFGCFSVNEGHYSRIRQKPSLIPEQMNLSWAEPYPRSLRPV